MSRIENKVFDCPRMQPRTQESPKDIDVTRSIKIYARKVRAMTFKKLFLNSFSTPFTFTIKNQFATSGN